MHKAIKCYLSVLLSISGKYTRAKAHFSKHATKSLSIRCLLNKDVDLNPKELFLIFKQQPVESRVASYRAIPLIFVRPKSLWKVEGKNIWIPFLSYWNEQAETEDQLSTAIIGFNYRKFSSLKKDCFLLSDLLYKHPIKKLVKQPQHPHQQPQHPHQQLKQFQQLQLQTQFKWQPCQQTQTYFLVREREGGGAKICDNRSYVLCT